MLPLTAEVGLNPVMPGMKKLFDAGEVALVQGVGYANPVYSHFEGLYIWEHADPTMQQTEGWLGKLLASQLDSRRTSTHRMRAGSGEHACGAPCAERNRQRHRVDPDVPGGGRRRPPRRGARPVQENAGHLRRAVRPGTDDSGVRDRRTRRFADALHAVGELHAEEHGLRQQEQPRRVAPTHRRDDRHAAERQDLSRRPRWLRHASGRGHAPERAALHMWTAR